MNTSADTTREYFSNSHSTEYDRKINASIPGYSTLHAMTGQLLRLTLPSSAQVLLAGIGTGTELISMARENPGWNFTAFDISEDMLKICRENADTAGITDRVEYVSGPIDTAPQKIFHGATSILVSHFLKTIAEKFRFFAGIAQRLQKGGILVTAELMTSGNDETSNLFLSAWKNYYLSNGIPQEEVEADFARRKQAVAEITEDELFDILMKSGFGNFSRFYQAFHFAGYLCRKE